MATLKGTTISETYPLLLKVESSGVDGTLRNIEDGDGTASALKISSGAIQVDNIKVDGNAITSTDSNGNIDLTPNGSGEVNISKVDIDSGTINGTTITSSVDIVIDTAGKGLADEAGNNILERTAGGYITIGDSAWNEVRLNTTGSTDFVLDNSGRIGIGTTSPSAKLDISGDTSSWAGMAKIYLTDVNSNSSSRNWSIGNGGTAYGALSFIVSNAEDGVPADSTGTAVMSMDGVNKLVGIGTTSPSSYNSNTNNLVIRDSGSGGITISTGASNTGYLAFNDGEDTTIEGLIAYNQSNDSMSFRTAGTDNRLVIDSSGNVGFGDTSPLTALTNFGSASRGLSIRNGQPTIALTDTDTGSGALYIANGGGISYFQNTVSGSTMRFYVESIQALTIENDGVLKSTDGIEFTGSALGGSQTGISSSGSGGDLRMFHNGTQLATLSQYGLGINCSNAGELSTSGTGQRYLSVDGGSNGGVVELRTSQNGDDYFIGAIDWVNAANGDSSNNDADGRLVCAIRSYTETSDSNSSDDSGGHMMFYTKPEAGSLAERMRIASDGTVRGGDDPSLSASQDLSAQGNKLFWSFGSAFGNIGLALNCGAYTSSYDLQRFYNGNGQVGAITTSGSGTSFTTSSDYRLKENEVLISDGLTRLNQLKPYRFNFKADKDTTVDGFFAHEVSDIVPEAIIGEKDAVDDDGNIVSQGIDQSKLVPLLVKALQEADDKIDALTARIEALEA